MNLVLWVVAGGLAGWIGFRFIGANAGRGLLTSLIIGIGGAYFGGSVLAPLLGDTPSMADAINPGALLMAFACAAVGLTVGDMIFRRV